LIMLAVLKPGGPEAPENFIKGVLALDAGLLVLAYLVRQGGGANCGYIGGADSQPRTGRGFSQLLPPPSPGARRAAYPTVTALVFSTAARRSLFPPARTSASP
jgi:hypothetical protein